MARDKEEEVKKKNTFSDTCFELVSAGVFVLMFDYIMLHLVHLQDTLSPTCDRVRVSFSNLRTQPVRLHACVRLSCAGH